MTVGTGGGPDHYRVLGVSAGADQEQIRAEYLARARDLHPDRMHTATADEIDKATREMARLNDAWAILSDPDKRRTYDQSLAPPPLPAGKRAARSAGTWMGKLYSEYLKGKAGS